MPDPDASRDTNIWVVAADNTDKGAHLTQITTNPGADSQPAWSPDGKWITYVTQLDVAPLLVRHATSRDRSFERRRGESAHDVV